MIDFISPGTTITQPNGDTIRPTHGDQIRVEDDLSIIMNIGDATTLSRENNSELVTIPALEVVLPNDAVVTLPEGESITVPQYCLTGEEPATRNQPQSEELLLPLIIN